MVVAPVARIGSHRPQPPAAQHWCRFPERAAVRGGDMPNARVVAPITLPSDIAGGAFFESPAVLRFGHAAALYHWSVNDGTIHTPRGRSPGQCRVGLNTFLSRGVVSGYGPFF